METGFNPEQAAPVSDEVARSATLPTIPLETAAAATMLHYLLKAAREFGVSSFDPLTDDFAGILGDTHHQLQYITSQKTRDHWAREEAAGAYVQENRDRILTLLEGDEPALVQIVADMPEPQPVVQVDPTLPSAATDTRVEHLLNEMCEVATTHLKADSESLSLGQVFALSHFIKQIGGPQFERRARDIMTGGNGYHESSTVNGTDISIGWDRGYKNFTIYLPQIETSIGWERGVSDQVIIISEKEEDAKRIYEFTVRNATTIGDVYDLYNVVQAEISNSIWNSHQE